MLRVVACVARLLRDTQALLLVHRLLRHARVTQTRA